MEVWVWSGCGVGVEWILVARDISIADLREHGKGKTRFVKGWIAHFIVAPCVL